MIVSDDSIFGKDKRDFQLHVMQQVGWSRKKNSNKIVTILLVDKNKKEFFGQPQICDLPDILLVHLIIMVIVKQQKKDDYKVLALVNESSAIVDLSNKNDNNQNGIDSIVSIYKTNGEIDDDAREEEIKKIKSWMDQ